MSFEDDVLNAVDPVTADAVKSAERMALMIAEYHRTLIESGVSSHLADLLTAQYQQMFLMTIMAKYQEKEEDNE